MDRNGRDGAEVPESRFLRPLFISILLVSMLLVFGRSVNDPLKGTIGSRVDALNDRAFADCSAADGTIGACSDSGPYRLVGRGSK